MRNKETAEKKPEASAPAPWSVPVVAQDVAESGQHFDLVADASIRAAIAEAVGLRDLPRLEAKLEVSRRGEGGLRVAGLVSATVGQNCVVTLEPLSNEVEEKVDLVFLPRQALAHQNGDAVGEPEPREVKWNDPEPLVNGIVDLGSLVTEFLILGLEPYPRKSGASFEPPPERQAEEESPFAALAKLTKGGDGR